MIGGNVRNVKRVRRQTYASEIASENASSATSIGKPDNQRKNPKRFKR